MQYNATPNKRLERTGHERASLLGCVGEPLKRSVRCFLKSRETLMMLKTILGIATVLAIVTGVGLGVHAQRKPACVTADNEVYEGRIQQLKGRVMYLNHPQLGRAPANGQYLVFQRQDCKDCLVATHADMNGD